MSVPVRILLVEDHASYRQALEAVMSLEPDLEVVAQVERGDRVGDALDTVRPDLAIVDLDLPGASGVDALTEIRQRLPGTACLVLTAIGDDIELARAVEAGAAAVVHKSVDIANLLDAVRAVARGETVLDPEATARWLTTLARSREGGWEARVLRETLSPREVEILEALAQGRHVDEIAAALTISRETVQTHIRNLRGKLGVSSRLEAVVKGIRLGLVDPPG